MIIGKTKKIFPERISLIESESQKHLNTLQMRSSLDNESNSKVNKT